MYHLPASPRFIMEVLSDSTEEYNRNEKSKFTVKLAYPSTG